MSQVTVTITAPTTAQAQVFGPDTPSVVEVGTVAPQQPVAAVRVDASTAGTVYVGQAAYAAAESAAVWKITRSIYTAAGVRSSKGTATGVTWTGRAVHTYT